MEACHGPHKTGDDPLQIMKNQCNMILQYSSQSNIVEYCLENIIEEEQAFINECGGIRNDDVNNFISLVNDAYNKDEASPDSPDMGYISDKIQQALGYLQQLSPAK